MTLIEGIPLELQGGNCTGRCIRAVLRFHGYSRPDFLLATQWATTYSKEPGKPFGTISGSKLSRYHALNKLGFQVSQEEGGDITTIVQANRRSITKGFPIIVWVDPKYLPYHPHHFSSTHTVIWHGYDKDSVWITDAGIYATYVGPISFHAFLRARSSLNPQHSLSSFSGFPICNRYVEIIPPNRQQLDTESHIQEYLRLTISDAFAEPTIQPMGEYEAVVYYGVGALREVAGDISKIVDGGDCPLALEIMSALGFSGSLLQLIDHRNCGYHVFKELFEQSSSARLKAASRDAMHYALDAENKLRIVRNLCRLAVHKRDANMLRRVGRLVGTVSSVERELFTVVSHIVQQL